MKGNKTVETTYNTSRYLQEIKIFLIQIPIQTEKFRPNLSRIK